MDPYLAGQTLGSLFGAKDRAYSAEMDRQQKLEAAKAEARYKRAQAVLAEGNVSQRGVMNDPALVGRFLAGDTDARNEYLTAATLANPNVDIKTLGEGLQVLYRQAARDKAVLGDADNPNAELFGVANGPVETTKISDGVAYSPLGSSSQTVNVTPLGEATIGQRRASTAASYASADNSRASAAKTRQEMAQGGADTLGSPRGMKAPSGYRWTADGNLQAIPGGPADKPGGGAASGASTLGDDLNPRQRVAVQGVQRNLLEYASALTGTPMQALRKMSAAEIGDLVEKNGGRYVQGGAARTLGRLPGGQLLGEVSNADILSYSQGAGAAWAAYENPTGMITNADRETSTAQMPTYLDPPKVQSRKIRSFLELSGYQPTLGDSPVAPARVEGLPAASGAPAPGTVRNGYRFRGGNPADRNSWEKI